MNSNMNINMNINTSADTHNPFAARLDRDRLREATYTVEELIRDQKLDIRTRPLPWERNLWSDLRQLKARATLLYAIRAHSRQRLHMRICMRAHAHLGLPQLEHVSFEDQARFIGDRWREFERAEADVPAAAEG